MKTLYIALISFLLSNFCLFGQVIRVELDLKNHKNDARNITGCNLEPQTANYKMYIHSGVCTATTSAVPDTIDCQNPDYVWEHVVGDWGIDNGFGEMTLLQDSVWEIFIDVDTFYSNPSTISQGGQSGEPPSTPKPLATTAYSMGFVFRNEDGTIGGKTGGCTDFFIFNLNQGNTNVDVGQPGFTLPDTTFSVQNTPTSIKQILSVNFEQIYPNPFSDMLKITYDSRSNAKDVRFVVYNMYGQKVRDLYSGIVPNGVSTLTWDGRSDSGQIVAKGAYLLTIEDNLYSQSHLVVKQ